MSNETIKKQALELSDKERAELAHLLIDSLKPEAKFESEQAWSKELKNGQHPVSSTNYTAV